MDISIKTSCEKHFPQGNVFFWFSGAITEWKVNTLHRDFMISFSNLPGRLYFPRKVISHLEVANTAVSLSILISHEKWFLGAGSLTWPPSSSNSRLFHSINSGDHLKSFKKIISASSAPTQAYISESGFAKVLNIDSSGFSRNVLPQPRKDKHFAVCF